MVVNPKSTDLIKEIDRCIDMGLTGVGEIFPYGQAFDITDAKEMSPLSNACIERDLPVMIHTNEAVDTIIAGKLTLLLLKQMYLHRTILILK